MSDFGYILAYEITTFARGATRVANILGFNKKQTGYLGGTSEDTDQEGLFLIRLYFKRVKDIDVDFVTQLDLPKSVRRVKIPLIMAPVMGIGGE